MTQLSNEEIRDIATQSGLSPEAVRRSLSESTSLARQSSGGMVPASVRGKSAAFVETRLAEAPDQAIQRVRAAIEKESKEKTGLHSEIVMLYRGGQYHLYRYKRYDDVRLVMAPEVAIGPGVDQLYGDAHGVPGAQHRRWR